MKIIHTGDLHLDSPFSALDPAASEKRRDALRSAFSSLIIHARLEDVRLFLIAGDFFDDECVTKDTVNFVINQMSSLLQCKFVIVPGNHDPYTDSSPYRLFKWPDNVFIFNSESMSTVEIEELNVRVYGSAYYGSSKAAFSDSTFKAIDDGKINILLHHGDIDQPRSPYCPLSTEALADSGFDYVALGHVHKGTEILHVGKNTGYAYCGCIEGRDFGETGYKGAIIGNIEKDGLNLKRVRICGKRYEVESFDVTGEENFAETAKRIADKCSVYGDDTFLRVELNGLTTEEFSANEDILRQYLPAVSYLEIKDKTSPTLNIERLKNDKSLAGEFYRQLEESLNSENEKEKETAFLALKYGLRAIYGMEIKA